MRIVEYVADDHTGFNAVVKKVGQAKHYHKGQLIEGLGGGYISGVGNGKGFIGGKHHAESYVSVEKH